MRKKKKKPERKEQWKNETKNPVLEGKIEHKKRTYIAKQKDKKRTEQEKSLKNIKKYTCEAGKKDKE